MSIVTENRTTEGMDRNTKVTDRILERTLEKTSQQDQQRRAQEKVVVASKGIDAEATRVAYDALNASLKQKKILIADKQARIETLKDSVDEEGAREEKELNTERFADGEINAKQLSVANAKYHTHMRAVEDATEACEVLDKQIAVLKEEVEDETRDLKHKSDLLQRAHIDTMLNSLPLDDIRATVMWARSLGYATKNLDEFFGIRSHADLTRPIVNKIKEGLGL